MLHAWNDFPLDGPPRYDSVSAVIPHRDAHRKLERALIGLARQQLAPDTRFEVIIADNGSRSRPDIDSGFPFPIRVIECPTAGFGTHIARNKGAEAANGELLIFLDSDMIPVPRFVENHRQRHITDYCVVVGARRHADFDTVNDEVLSNLLDRGADLGDALFMGDWSHPAWRSRHWRRWEGGRSPAEDYWRVCSGGNLSVGRRFHLEISGFDETIDCWGVEDIEYGYRLHIAGALWWFEFSALAWHQGIESSRSGDKAQRFEASKPVVHNLVPSDDRPFKALRYSRADAYVEIDAAHSEHMRVLSCVDSLLSTAGGVQLEIAVTGLPSRESELLGRYVDSDARISIGRSTTSVAPVRGRIPPDARVDVEAVWERLLHQQPRCGIVYTPDGGVFWLSRAANRIARLRRSCADSDATLSEIAVTFGIAPYPLTVDDAVVRRPPGGEASSIDSEIARLAGRLPPKLLDRIRHALAAASWSGELSLRSLIVSYLGTLVPPRLRKRIPRRLVVALRGRGRTR
jgi:glycosyltransferase involved in cell wall biosynthesis